ncbi:ferrous iron transport protein B [Eubacterium oxidoreducens]|uniref:Ferrous iron transport protein B n=1 Tax=Eubacterium oxidoreducens TaxID=1732 RepID=A0A1G6BN14_EUBOX|nr:ferrous iron transport protein B [Eubacterium oxidoreducens]SDB21979.1 ferrous iron transport protein B [Eubacterium oxidoreducens]
MAIKIALAGNPNCGKTTLFNSLTGSNQYVGNWPGVTVEKKEGKLKGNKEVIIQDLPGIYSLSPYTLEEVVSRTYLVNEKPDAILNIVDGTNIERNLYLTTQLIELGIPVVMAVNMMDLVRKKGDKINVKKLSEQLGCEVIEISALKGESVTQAAELAVKAAKKKHVTAPVTFSAEIETAIDQIAAQIDGLVDASLLRWYSIKLFERDAKVLESLSLNTQKANALEKIVSDVEKSQDDDSESIITNERYTYITNVCTDAVEKKGKKSDLTVSDKIDKIVTNRILGIPIFVGIMFLVYAISMGGWVVSIGTMATDFTNDVIFGEWVPGAIDALFAGAGVADTSVVYGVVQDGIVAGVGAVLGFVPQMLVLFLLLAILEDIGYMSRVAFVMDRIFRQFGLSGKSFIPMLVATGCGVPGVMASRTIENERDRKMTVMTTTFMPCGAKMPIIGLIAGALFGGSALIAVSAYFIGIASIVLTGIILKKFKAFAGEPAPFVMELPAYHLPPVGNVLRAMWERGWSFIKRAGSVIVLATIVIWFLSNFGFVNGQFGNVNTLYEDPAVATESYVQSVADDMNVSVDEVNAMDSSILAAIGQKVSVIFVPQGLNSWKPTVATVTGLIAKENVVGTFGVLYNYDDSTEELGENGEQIWAAVAADYTAASAFAFMCFNLLCAPCFAAIGAIKREMNNAKWTWATIGFQCLWAYVIALIAYRVGGLFSGDVAFNGWTIVGIVLIVGIIVLLVRKGYKPDESTRSITSVEAAVN